ncbi:class I SAM-dependent methyltransferase [Eubacteriaceae bacterium ES2]|nr:class I SAM-dependent methyltransferase [Eubacteriaceae bacterium ES2]
MSSNSLRVTDLVWTFLKPVIKEGDTVMDATAGNGHDTLKLAQSVGSNGCVFAFDLQETAIRNTRKLLDENGLLDRVKLFQGDHSSFDAYLAESAVSGFKAIVINLGYLPGGSRQIVTKTESSRKLLEKCLDHLEDQGLITVCLYPGHPEGEKEAKALLEWAGQLKKPFIAHHFITLNRNQPPSLLMIQKMRVS